MALARFHEMHVGHLILFAVFLLFYAVLLIGLLARLVKRKIAEAREGQ